MVVFGRVKLNSIELQPEGGWEEGGRGKGEEDDMYMYIYTSHA